MCWKRKPRWREILGFLDTVQPQIPSSPFSPSSDHPTPWSGLRLLDALLILTTRGYQPHTLPSPFSEHWNSSTPTPTPTPRGWAKFVIWTCTEMQTKQKCREHRYHKCFLLQSCHRQRISKVEDELESVPSAGTQGAAP